MLGQSAMVWLCANIINWSKGKMLAKSRHHHPNSRGKLRMLKYADEYGVHAAKTTVRESPCRFQREALCTLYILYPNLSVGLGAGVPHIVTPPPQKKTGPRTVLNHFVK